MPQLSRRTLLAGSAASVLFAASCSSTDATSTPSALDTGPATIRFTWWGNASRHEATQKIIDQFTAAHPQITVNAEPRDFTGYFDKLATEVAGGNAPDLVTLGGAYLPEYATRGSLFDLSKVSQQFSFDKIDEGARTNGLVKGTQYGATTGVNAVSCIANPKVFSAAGVSLPDDETWTWQQYADIAKKIQGASPAGTYGTSQAITHDTLDLWARQRGEALYTQDGKLGLTAATITDFFQFALDLVKGNGAPPASVITEQSTLPNEQTLMGTGKSGMTLVWSNTLSPLSTASGSDLVLLKPPGAHGSNSGMWLQSSQFFAIYSKSKYPAQCALLLDHLLNSPEAGKIVLTDRGVPTNSEVRDAISGSLSTAGKAEVAYIAKVGAMDLPPTFIGPNGSTEVANITKRMLEDVMFDRQTPAAAATQWMSESASAIS